MPRLKYTNRLFIVAFFAIVPALLLTALIKTPCPVCGGTGSVTNAPGMANVKILDLSFVELKRVQDTCGVYTVWKFNTKIQMLNDGNEEAVGWIKIMLIDTSKDEGNNMVDSQFVKVDVPVQSIINSDYNVVFGTGLDQPGKTLLRAEVVIGGIPCIACNGTGKIPLNARPFVSSLKEYLKELTRSENEYHPPVFIDWSQYIMSDQ
ncbi:MAG: hypothetical protein C4542_06020 [Dehalococcoidia bacterium]|nr:MAG: hypothetical protein C4542_06020 [Dehalococcoidia bacterium]